MGDSGKQICRLCLERTPACESEHIEEIKKDVLKVLLINIDFEVSDCAVVCSICLEKLQDCFDFKSRCINALMDVDFKLDIKKEVLQSQLINHESTCQESSQVCRFCMLFIGDETFNHTAVWKDGVLFQDVIRSCFPEMDLNTVRELVMCKQCLSSMEKHYEFMKSCQEIEQRIERFRRVAGHGTTGRVSLEDVLKFKDYNVLGKPLIAEKEYSDFDNVTESVIKCLKKEETLSIKCDEIDIKDELLFSGMETSDPDQSEGDDSCGKDGFLKTDRELGKIAKKGETYFCPKCPHSSKTSALMKKHLRTHSDNETHGCFLCPFITDTKFSLKVHMTSHRGPTKAYGCLECPFETGHKFSYLRHLLTHKDKSEVEIQKCPLCPYKTKCRTVEMHLKRHHNMNKRKMYKCKECSYGTNHKVSWLSHQLAHMNPEEIPRHKCEKCEFETKYKQSLVRHMIIHEDPKMVNKFQCDKCPYRSKRQHMKNHMMVHSDKRPFSCDQCAYSSKFMRQLVAHKRVHQKDSERKMYKCKVCDYQAKKDITLKAHMAVCHMDPSVPIMRCAHCPYETPVKYYLSKHITKWHMGLGHGINSREILTETHLGKQELPEDEEDESES